MPVVLRASENTGSVVVVCQVVCTGKEERLLDCYFPEYFGELDYYGSDGYDDYGVNGPTSGTPSSTAPQLAPTEVAPAPSGAPRGLRSSFCDNRENERLGVLCRRFEITGALCPAEAIPLACQDLAMSSHAFAIN